MALLERYGRKVIVLDEGNGIGKAWVPPMGAMSPIDPHYVVPPGYADMLARRGYRPQPTRRLHDAVNTLIVVLVVLAVAVAILSA